MQLIWRVFLSILIVVLTVGDIITSYIIFSLGIGFEGNPIVDGMMNSLGEWWWIPKLILSVILSIMAFSMWNGNWAKRQWEIPVARLLIGLYVVFYTMLFAHHIAILRIFSQLKTVCG